MKTKFLQAYEQAPWRKQLQWIGVFLLILVSLAVIAGIYLSISGQAAATGRRVQNLEMQVESLKLEINDLSTQLAEISSARALNERLKGTDMVTLDPAQALYVEVPGYLPEEKIALAPPPSPEKASAVELLPEFTASLWDWLRSYTWKPAPTAEATPEVLP